MTCDTVDTDTLRIDDMHVVRPRAAGLDIHKMRITAAVRLCEAGSGPARTALRELRHVQTKLEPLAKALAATLDPLAILTLQMQVAAVERADTALAALDTHIRTELAAYQRPLQLLQTIPGIDLGSASTILVEIGPDVGAFRGPRHLCAWAGVAPGNNASAGKRRSGRTLPGNRTLRATLAECAHGAARCTSSQFHGYHQTLAARRGYKRAILATAMRPRVFPAEDWPTAAHGGRRRPRFNEAAGIPRGRHALDRVCEQVALGLQ